MCDNNDIENLRWELDRLKERLDDAEQAIESLASQLNEAHRN